MVEDPVCGTEVDPDRAMHETVYRGNVYRFHDYRYRESLGKTLCIVSNIDSQEWSIVIYRP